MPRGRLFLARTVSPLSVAMLAASTFAVAGCDSANRLETGYRYSPIGATAVERRAFYADRFSPEAVRGEQGTDDPFGRGRSPVGQ